MLELDDVLGVSSFTIDVDNAEFPERFTSDWCGEFTLEGTR